MGDCADSSCVSTPLRYFPHNLHSFHTFWKCSSKDGVKGANPIDQNDMWPVRKHRAFLTHYSGACRSHKHHTRLVLLPLQPPRSQGSSLLSVQADQMGTYMHPSTGLEKGPAMHGHRENPNFCPKKQYSFIHFAYCLSNREVFKAATTMLWNCPILIT